MNISRLFPLFILLGWLLTTSLASAEPPDAAPTAARMAEIYLETGLIPSLTANPDPRCDFYDEYGLFLCPEPPPAVLPQRDSLAHAQALAIFSADGLLLVPDSTNKRVLALDPTTGDVLDANYILDPDHLSTPISVVGSPDGRYILVSDNTNDVIQKYDTAGNYVGVFAPAGGVNTSILDNPRGIAWVDNFLFVTEGVNDSVLVFDSQGNFVDVAIPSGFGGLDSPYDFYDRFDDALVGGITSDAIHRYDGTAVYPGDFAAPIAFPQQITASSDGHIWVANFSTPNRGLVEYLADGTFVAAYSPLDAGHRGVYQLPNGNLLTTSGSTLLEMDRMGNIVDTKLEEGGFMRYIEFATLKSYLYLPFITKP